MTHRTAAARYARALLDVALKEQADLSAIDADLTGFADLLRQHEALRRALVHPSVPVPRKIAAVADLVARGRVHPLAGKTLQLLADRDRLVLVPEVAAAFRDRLLDHRNIVRASVTTAEPLSADRVQQIRQSLAKATGRTVELTAAVDPAIVGGMVARVGSTVYDGSVTRQLQKMKEQLQQQ